MTSAKIPLHRHFVVLLYHIYFLDNSHAKLHLFNYSDTILFFASHTIPFTRELVTFCYYNINLQFQFKKQWRGPTLVFFVEKHLSIFFLEVMVVVADYL